MCRAHSPLHEPGTFVYDLSTTSKCRQCWPLKAAKSLHAHEQTRGKPRVGKSTPAHQDGFYDKIQPIEMVNMWLALDPVDEQNGCVRYIVGSHKCGLRDHTRTNTLGFSQGLVDYGPQDQAHEVAICAAPGDILVHHGLTIHRADGNTSNRNRRALGSVYCAAHVKKNHVIADNYRRQLTCELLHDGKI